MIQEQIKKNIAESIETKQKVLETMPAKIEVVAQLLIQKLQDGGKLLLCGNGGSAADAQHLAAELVVRLRSTFNRPAISALALTVDTSILTAGGNDIGFENIFARQIEALGNKSDVLIAISTSGNSENIIKAIKVAEEKGISTIGFLGGSGGNLKEMVDLPLVVPSSTTARIQEAHILIGHILCELIEEALYQN